MWKALFYRIVYNLMFKNKYDKLSLWDDYYEEIKMTKIKDERCYCGHLKSEHFNTLVRGHGKCKKCWCKKFTWKEFVYGE
jgi:hypothetical protein